MIQVLLITFGILLLVVVGASIGVIFKREPIKGSCGGLSTLGFQKACSCKEPCDAALARMASEQTTIQTDNNNITISSSDSSVTDYAKNRTGEGVYRP